ncbi:MAG TPA: ATP-dependent sacrificial sulfur transferase LarE [Candidatus Thermoplasmatota archaeon]|nr:ATP-dependent sacrificial sulfur transferase LarE [Candidatus Thermoplasmatota archaeon]
MAVQDRLSELLSLFEGQGRVVVGYSGGVDSALLAAAATRTLGRENAVAVTVDSESLPRSELATACESARAMGLWHEVVRTSELANPRYAENPVNRCYFCREEMSRVLLDAAGRWQATRVAVGVNASDLREWRPGIAASRAAGLWMPLLDLGLGKDDVRALARAMELPVADKPSMACLSSRIPFGETITVEKLARVERAEAALRARGFAQVRVRSHGDVARVEVEPHELARARRAGAEIERDLRAAGFAFVTLDAKGYRSGSLSEALVVEKETFK